VADLTTATHDVADAHKRLADLVDRRKVAREHRDTIEANRLTTEIHGAFDDYCTARAMLQAELVDHSPADKSLRHSVRLLHLR
jgi:hypothetical protein